MNGSPKVKRTFLITFGIVKAMHNARGVDWNRIAEKACQAELRRRADASRKAVRR